MKKLVLIFLLMFLFSALVSCKDTTEVVNENGVIVLNNGDKIYKEGYLDSATTLKISFTEAGFGRNWLVQIATQFVDKYPEYMVVLDGDPQLASSLATKLESGRNLSDIFFPLNSPWETYAYKGWLEPLDDLYEMIPDGENKTNAEKMDEVYREYSKLSTADGTHYYCMPWNDTITGICYNYNMFQEYGWNIPTTTDELETLCQKILSDTNGKIKPFAYPGKIGGYFDFLGSTWWMQASGVDGYKKFFDFESYDIYNSEIDPGRGKLLALKEVVRFYSMDKGYCISGSMSKDHITSQMDFINSKAAMILNANWLETEMKDSMDEDFVMGMMRIPYLSNAKKDENGEFIKVNYVTPPDYIVIPKGASNIEGAKKFLNFMNTDEMLLLYTKYTGSPRPFDYDTSSLTDLSKFTMDCLKIREESNNYFDFSRAKIYQNGYGTKYIGGQPYSALIRGDNTPERFCEIEFFEAEDNWSTWQARSN